MSKTAIWLRGLAAASISGACGGIINAFTAMGIAPEVFNFTGGLKHLFMLAGVSTMLTGILGVAFYLKQSPLPGNPKTPSVTPPAMP
jgi:hypothetical protein